MNVGGAPQQSMHRLWTSLANGAVQRSYAALIERVWIGSILDQQGDHGGLGQRIPALDYGSAIGRVVQRGGSPPVYRGDIGSIVEERLGNIFSIAGGGGVQGCVAGVQVVVDFSEVEIGRRLARCTNG